MACVSCWVMKRWSTSSAVARIPQKRLDLCLIRRSTLVLKTTLLSSWYRLVHGENTSLPQVPCSIVSGETCSVRETRLWTEWQVYCTLKKMDCKYGSIMNWTFFESEVFLVYHHFGSNVYVQFKGLREEDFPCKITSNHSLKATAGWIHPF